MNDIASKKSAARKLASQVRKQAAAAGEKAAEELAVNFLHAGLVQSSQIIGAFMPIGSEIDLTCLLDKLHQQHYSLSMPCVAAADSPLVFRPWQPGDALVKEAYGTFAPSEDKPLMTPDVLIVPLLAFDKQGYRLGYGGGFYDRTLLALRRVKPVIAIGVAYSAQQVNSLPIDGFDQPLDWIVTEAGVHKFNE